MTKAEEQGSNPSNNAVALEVPSQEDEGPETTDTAGNILAVTNNLAEKSLTSGEGFESSSFQVIFSQV